MSSIKQIPYIKPDTISFITTYKCTASCNNCCFGCSPTRTERIFKPNILKIIKQSIELYRDSLKLLVLTGGECFIFYKEIIDIIKFASEEGLLVRVITNGYWCTNKLITYKKLTQLKNAGLNEINFSTGDEHQKWVKLPNILNGASVSMSLGITTLINVETHDNSKFDYKLLYQHKELQPYINKKESPLIINRSVWIPFTKEKFSYNKSIIHKNRTTCNSILHTISISPNSEILSCCGLTSNRITYLILGDLKKASLHDLYLSQFFDFIKIWIYTEGPFVISNYLNTTFNKNIPIHTHICEQCKEILNNQHNIELLKNIPSDKKNNIFFKYILKIKSNEKQ